MNSEDLAIEYYRRRGEIIYYENRKALKGLKWVMIWFTTAIFLMILVAWLN